MITSILPDTTETSQEKESLFFLEQAISALKTTPDDIIAACVLKHAENPAQIRHARSTLNTCIGQIESIKENLEYESLSKIRQDIGVNYPGDLVVVGYVKNYLAKPNSEEEPIHPRFTATHMNADNQLIREEESLLESRIPGLWMYTETRSINGVVIAEKLSIVGSEDYKTLKNRPPQS